MTGSWSKLVLRGATAGLLSTGSISGVCTYTASTGGIYCCTRPKPMMLYISTPNTWGVCTAGTGSICKTMYCAHFDLACSRRAAVVCRGASRAPRRRLAGCKSTQQVRCRMHDSFAHSRGEKSTRKSFSHDLARRKQHKPLEGLEGYS